MFVYEVHKPVSVGFFFIFPCGLYFCRAEQKHCTMIKLGWWLTHLSSDPPELQFSMFAFFAQVWQRQCDYALHTLCSQGNIMDLYPARNGDSVLPWAEYLGCQKCLKGGWMVVSSHKNACKNQ